MRQFKVKLLQGPFTSFRKLSNIFHLEVTVVTENVVIYVKDTKMRLPHCLLTFSTLLSSRF